MHRMRVGLVAAAVLLVTTVVVFFASMSVVSTAAKNDTESRVQRAGRLFDQLNRLRAADFAKTTAERARTTGMVGIFDEKNDETAKRKAAFEECEAVNAVLQKQQGRKADIVGVINAAGKLVARDLNPQIQGEDWKARPAVARALAGEATKDVWAMPEGMTEVAVAPISRPSGGAPVGALLIGYVLSTTQAQDARTSLNVDVAYFMGGTMRASSFVIDGAGGKEDTAKTQALGAALFASKAQTVNAALGQKGPSALDHFVLEGREHAFVVSALGGNLSDKTSGFVVLASPSHALADVRGVLPLVLVLGVFGIAVALAAAVMTAKRFLNPLDRIELGVEEVIAGNIDYTFKPVGPDFEGLSNRLNVMLARLLGKDEPSEDAVDDEEGAPKWKAEQMLLEEGDGAAPAPVVQALGQEGEAAYYPRLYNEYTTALRAAGQSTDGLSMPAFMAKLRLAEAGLVEKWGCRVVRFQLAARGSQPVFRAVRVQ